MRRIINFRSFLIIFAVIVCSILIALFSYNSSIVGFILLVLLFVILALVVTLLIINKIRLLKILTFSLTLVLASIACINFVVTLNTWTINDTIQRMDIQGSIESTAIEDDILLINLYKLTLNGEKVNGKMLVKVKNFQETKMEFAKVGDKVEFSGAVKPIKLIEGYKINGSNYRKNYRYSTQVTEDIFKLTIGKPTLLQNFSLKLKATLIKNMGEDYGNLAYSILSGDKTELNEDISDDFRIAGLSHILAVSGLHVGFLTLLIAWILTKFNAGRKLTFAITSIFLFLYMAFAGFSPSVLRAVIMSLIALITLFNQKRKDALSSLLCAGSLMLCVKPLYLFEVGFLMSFTAVLSMVFFEKPIRRTIKRIVKFLPDKIAGYISTSISVQIGITPVMIYFLKNIQLYSIMVNIFVIPLMMILFIFLLLFAILTLIFPFIGFILTVPKLGLSLIDWVAQHVAQLPSAIYISFANITIFACYLIYFAMSRFVLKPKKWRWLTTTIGCAICVTLIFFNDYSYNLKSVIAPIDDPYSSISVIVEQNKTYIIGDMEYAGSIKYKLISMRIKKVDAIFLTEMNSKTCSEIIKLNRFYKIPNVYCLDSSKIEGVANLIAEDIAFTLLDKNDQVGNISLVYDENTFVGYKLKSFTDILFLSDKVNLDKISSKTLRPFKVIRCTYFSEKLPDAKIYLTYYNYGFSTNDNSYKIDLQSNPNYIFDFFTGKTFRLLEII